MTIAATATAVQYVRNGSTTQWSFPNKIFSAADLIVNDILGTTVTPLVLGTDYTVQNVDIDTGCAITTTAPGVTGHILDIRSNVAELQSTSIKNQGSFLPELHEEFFDRITREIQDLKRLAYTFGIHGPDTEVASWTALPAVPIRANNVLGFGSTGLPTLYPTQVFPVLQIVSVMQYGAVGNGIADDTAAIQACVNANPGAWIIFPGLSFRISSQINILTACKITGVLGHTTIILATQNQNGFVVGDGTSPTRALCYNTLIEGISFNPSATVAAFTSGICIYFNFVAFVFVRDCTFYGSNGSATILFEGMRAYQTIEWEAYKCRFTLMLGKGMNCFGTNTTTLQTNDGRIDMCEFTSIGNDAIYIGAYANGITINMPICYADTHNVIHIDTTGVGKPYNIFILQPDIELDSAGIVAINCTDDVGLKQIIGGWIGMGSLAIAATAVSVVSTSGGLEMSGVNCTQTNIVLSGPACKISGGEISGDNATTPTGITINATATDTEIVGVRVRQWITSGITFVGGPIRCLVDGVIFRLNGVDFTGQNFSAAGLQPQISGCRTDASNVVLPAASIVLHPALPFYQLQGAATTITTLSMLSQGQRVTFEALDAAGDTFGGGGNIQLKTAPTTVPQFKTISFICDGNANFFEDGRNF